MNRHWIKRKYKAGDPVVVFLTDNNPTCTAADAQIARLINDFDVDSSSSAPRIRLKNKKIIKENFIWVPLAEVR